MLTLCRWRVSSRILSVGRLPASVHVTRCQSGALSVVPGAVSTSAKHRTTLCPVSLWAPRHCVCALQRLPIAQSVVRYSNESAPPVKVSNTERVKVILREYGTVAVVFHTVISLCSLGTCYLVVSSGVDVGKVLEYFNVQTSVASKGASTFAIAYILHKLFLPLRATITVASVPLIVRWLRARGWMKGVAKQPK